jgi:hypothetical protein
MGMGNRYFGKVYPESLDPARDGLRRRAQYKKSRGNASTMRTPSVLPRLANKKWARRDSNP